LKCLEALDPHVKAIAEKQHIDYHFSGLEDDASDNGDYSSEQDDCSDDEDLSFDYEINDKDQDFLGSIGSMDVSSVVHISVSFFFVTTCLCPSSA
jgi:hypothetical protein